MKMKKLRIFGVALLLAVVLGFLIQRVDHGVEHVHAATSKFAGVNWADVGDNFQSGDEILDGLTSSDSYATVEAKTNAVVSALATNLGANTIRIPINPPTVSTSWWNSYSGVIDEATSKGFNVIISYWSNNNGVIDSSSSFWAMWTTVVNQYTSNSHAYFEIMNEPHGYSDTDWRNLAAQWLTTFPNVPQGRVIVSGSGYNSSLGSVGGDSRFNNCLLSLHLYPDWHTGDNTEAAWRTELQNDLGGYQSRAIVDEFGAPMTNGSGYSGGVLNYNGAINGNYYIAFMYGVPNQIHDYGMGAVYWPGVKSGDSYRMEELGGSGTNLTLTNTNASGRVQLQWAWGISGGGSTPTPGPTSTPGGSTNKVVGQQSGKCLDVAGGSTSAGANVDIATCTGAASQNWSFTASSSGYYTVVNKNSGLCLDVIGASKTAGAYVEQWTCNGGSNQHWSWTTNGSYDTMQSQNSGLCLDVYGQGTADGTRLDQWTCNGGSNQNWAKK